MGLNEKSVSRAEMLVLASDEWRDYTDKMVKARTAANKAKIQMDYLKMRFAEWNSADANHRHEARLSRG